MRARVVNAHDDLLPYRPVVLHLCVLPFVPDAVRVRVVFDHSGGGVQTAVRRGSSRRTVTHTHTFGYAVSTPVRVSHKTRRRRRRHERARASDFRSGNWTAWTANARRTTLAGPVKMVSAEAAAAAIDDGRAPRARTHAHAPLYIYVSCSIPQCCRPTRKPPSVSPFPAFPVPSPPPPPAALTFPYVYTTIRRVPKRPRRAFRFRTFYSFSTPFSVPSSPRVYFYSYTTTARRVP